MQDRTDTSNIEDIGALVERARSRDRDAFARLYDLHMEQIYSYVRYRLNSVADAEDLTQQVFLRSWQLIHRYESKGVPFVGWLFRIAHNLVIDHYRKSKSNVSTEDQILVSNTSDDPETNAERHETQEQLRQAIMKLSPDQQQVIVLRFIQGWDYPSVAAAMGKNEGNVRVLQYRALTALRRIMEGGI